MSARGGAARRSRNVPTSNRDYGHGAAQVSCASVCRDLACRGSQRAWARSSSCVERGNGGTAKARAYRDLLPQEMRHAKFRSDAARRRERARSTSPSETKCVPAYAYLPSQHARSWLGWPFAAQFRARARAPSSKQEAVAAWPSVPRRGSQWPGRARRSKQVIRRAPRSPQ